MRQTAYRLKWPTVFWLSLLHVGALAAPWTFSWQGVVLMLGLGWLTGSIGVCLGYHRLFTHRSLAVSRPLRWVIAMFGTWSGQGPLIEWVADHRKHHALSDREGDPHTPNDGGFWSHILWLIWEPTDDTVEEHCRRWAPDLMKDPVLRFFDRFYMLWHFLLAGVLFGIGFLVGGAAMGWSFVVWGMFVRLVYVLHATFFVNSASHIWGYRNYDTRDNSRNLWWVAIVSYGEGWHNNHHAYPRSANNRHKWWEFDPTYVAIRLLAAVGLAWDVVERPQANAVDADTSRSAARGVAKSAAN